MKNATRMYKRPDVIVMGGGLAGVSAALLLGRRGYDVICIGPAPKPDYGLGESLDFAAPALFAELGFDDKDLVCQNSATWKKLIKVETFSGESFVLRPLEFFESVFGTETRTLHVDRAKFDAALRKAARSAGVKFVDAKVVGLESDGLTVANTMAATKGITSSDPCPARARAVSSVVTTCWQRGR